MRQPEIFLLSLFLTIVILSAAKNLTQFGAPQMPKDVTYFVYILSSKTRVLYVGVTNSLIRRIDEHRAGEGGEFSKRYKTHRLVYYEVFQYVHNAIHRETGLKGWKRSRKVELIQSMNPTWRDLYDDFGKQYFYVPPETR